MPEAYRGRLLYEHNAQVTLMRTSADENRRMGEWIAAKLNACAGPVRFLMPRGGVSIIDVPGQAFHDPAADAALFEALERNVVQSGQRRLISLPYAINDAAFAQALVEHFNDVMGSKQ